MSAFDILLIGLVAGSTSTVFSLIVNIILAKLSARRLERSINELKKGYELLKNLETSPRSSARTH